MQKDFPVVMRMQGMTPADIGGLEGHRYRKGGDLGHIDKHRSGLNRRLIGSEDWAAEVLSELDEMKTDNFIKELETLKKRRQKTELKRRAVEGPRDPWRPTRHGPMREIILTANKEWFQQADDPFGADRTEQFETLAVGWLTEHFDGDVVHARADLDEEAYHIHAVVFPRAVTKDGRRMLQPSKHPMIKDYEAAQDSVGEWFAELGLTRGERRKAKIREAIQHNRMQRDASDQIPVPSHREHVSPREWRAQQETKLAERDTRLTKQAADIDTRERAVTQREQQTEAAEASVSERATKLNADRKRLAKREQTANAIMTAARRVETTGAAALGGTAASSPDRTSKLVARLFGPALARLRKDAQDEAEASVAAERRRLKKAAEAVEAAREALGSIWTALPASLSATLQRPRNKFLASAVALKRLLNSPEQQSAKRPGEDR